MVEVGTSHPTVGGNTEWAATMPRFIQVWFGGIIYRFEQDHTVTVSILKTKQYSNFLSVGFL